ncbi:uncharacterized protein [Pleurodeles waltl]|uniref:uncharacterized protein isoform X2 n=1 Tax=Pleurodeles waltl TaxID=8319 RepID=UPI00370945B9
MTRMRVFHFNGRHCQGHNGLRLEQQYRVRRYPFSKNNGCYKVQPDSEFYIRSNVYPDDFSKIMKHGLRRLSKKITIDGNDGSKRE